MAKSKNSEIYTYQKIAGTPDGKNHRVVRAEDGKRLWRFDTEAEAKAHAKAMNENPREEDLPG